MKIGMLFSDYGSQYVGMGKELYDNSRLIQEYFEEAFNCLNINFVKLCFASSDAELAKIEHAYVSIFLLSVATAALLKQENIIPDEVAGYGIGEVSAIAVANGLSLPDGLYFLNKYAQFYQEFLYNNSNMQMLRIEGIAPSTMSKYCKIVNADLAVIETEIQQIVSGKKQSLDDLKELIKVQKQFIQEVPVEQGLHSSLMLPVVDQLIKYLEKIDFKDLDIPFFSTVDASLNKKKELIKKRIIKQFYSSIHWNKMMKHCAHWDLIIEIGPVMKISKLLKQKYPEKLFFQVQKWSDIEELKRIINEHTTTETIPGTNT